MGLALPWGQVEDAEPSSPVLPDFAGACTANLVPALLGDPDALPSWMPPVLGEVDQVCLMVIDGLGWNQLKTFQSLLPTTADMVQQPITTVAPTTTATALTSISTGLPPGEHGIMGYRMSVNGEVLNCLRWSVPRGDARGLYPPHEVCRADAFEAQRPPIVVKAEFEGSGFTQAHLRGSRIVPYRMPSTLAIEIDRVLRTREPFVYAYYDGVDKVAHEYGLGEHYRAELIGLERLLEYIVAALPPKAALVITADHGHIDVGDAVIKPAPEVMSMVDYQSGEGRFRWLHASAGAQAELLAAARQHHSDVAWIRGRDEMIDEGWFGPKVSDAARSRLGDVALVAREPISFDDPADSGPYKLVGRHGSMTADEVLVPLLVAIGR